MGNPGRCWLPSTVPDICLLADPLKSGEFHGFLLAIEAVAYTGKVVQVTGLGEIISHSAGVLMLNQPGGF